eukprot:715103_1
MALLSQLILSQLLYLSASIDSDCGGGACTPFTTEDKQAILDLHNELRDRLAGGGLVSQNHPAATDMNYLIWDEGLEAVAQAYAETCPSGHNADRKFQIKYQRDATPQNTKWGTKNGNTFTTTSCDSDETCIKIGENLAWNGDNYDLDLILSQIETGWWDEYTIWTYGMTNDGCSPNGEHNSCGHYTQMAWANTRYIGCGYANGCSGYSGTFACNYFPSGNFNGDDYPPYTSGTACSSCDADRWQCKSIYDSRSITAGSYGAQPYDALCGGGACPTMCDGSASSVMAPNYCNMCTPTPENIDCNDGTIAIDDGRDLCGWTRAPSQPTQSPIPTVAPTAAPCVILSNHGSNDGKWTEMGMHNGEKYYKMNSKYLNWESTWVDGWAIVDNLGDTSVYRYCRQTDLLSCTAGEWTYYSGGWLTDSDATVTACVPPTPAPTSTPAPTANPSVGTPTVETSNPTTASPTNTPTLSPITPCVILSNLASYHSAFEGSWDQSGTYNGEPYYTKFAYSKTYYLKLLANGPRWAVTSSLETTSYARYCTVGHTDLFTCDAGTWTYYDGELKADNTATTAACVVPTDSPIQPTQNPTKNPTKKPTFNPTKSPSKYPTNKPTKIPTDVPTDSPSKSPTKTPTHVPTAGPTKSPSGNPTSTPSDDPTSVPSKTPTRVPTADPSKSPSDNPTSTPTKQPTINPTKVPTDAPTKSPTFNPTKPPTVNPTDTPTNNPIPAPTTDTQSPSKNPTHVIPTTANPSGDPTMAPSDNPTLHPTDIPSSNPSQSPTNNPSQSPTDNPTSIPTKSPTSNPSEAPSDTPSANPSAFPTTSPTDNPTVFPTQNPTKSPTSNPSANPSQSPTDNPTPRPTTNTQHPSKNPTPVIPTTANPSGSPTDAPSNNPVTQTPTSTPSVLPTHSPTKSPTSDPTSRPSDNPSFAPVTQNPTTAPSLDPTDNPSVTPTAAPSSDPSTAPTRSTSNPSSSPTKTPTSTPSDNPTTAAPTRKDQLSCGERQTGTYEDSTLAFWIRMPYHGGHFTFDATNTPFALTGLSVSDSTEYTFFEVRDGSKTLSFTNLNVNNYVFMMTAASGTTGQYDITIRCRSNNPTNAPSEDPSMSPSRVPTASPSDNPTSNPTDGPTRSPSINPSISPSNVPTRSPTSNPTNVPSRSPLRNGQTLEPTENPTISPTNVPTSTPVERATNNPSITPTSVPSESPTLSNLNLRFVCKYRDRSPSFYNSIALTAYAQIMVDAVLFSLESITGHSTNYKDTNEWKSTSWNRAAIVDFSICRIFSDVQLDIDCDTGDSDSDESMDSDDEDNEYIAIGRFGIAADQSLDMYNEYLKHHMTSKYFYQVFANEMNDGLDDALGDVSRRRRLLDDDVDRFEVLSVEIIDVTSDDDDDGGSEDNQRAGTTDLLTSDTMTTTFIIGAACLFALILIIAMCVYFKKLKRKKVATQMEMSGIMGKIRDGDGDHELQRGDEGYSNIRTGAGKGRKEDKIMAELKLKLQVKAAPVRSFSADPDDEVVQDGVESPLVITGKVESPKPVVVAAKDDEEEVDGVALPVTTGGDEESKEDVEDQPQIVLEDKGNDDPKEGDEALPLTTNTNGQFVD